MSIIKPMLRLMPLILLASCGSIDGQFPSLERRAYENNDAITAPITPPAAPVSMSVELKAQVDALLARHQVAHAAYLERLDAVRAVAARAAGSAPGSEAWVNAHVTLSRLDKIRDDSVAVVRAFDGLIADANAGDSGLSALLTDAQKPVLDDVAVQNDEIRRLSRLIGE
ncbi:hypothetical protein [Sphingorhabdus sp.]|jgi:hypothetical protein|uniref:hypothetical protein n=1 Tax=Sphingorhabdus sp. TaxID=1902408 RepID=UPI0037851B5F